MNEKLDILDFSILKALQLDSRQSFNRLAKICGSSAPTVAERIRRMEDLGVIEGYSIKVNPKQLGWQIKAFIRITCTQEMYPTINRLVNNVMEILECHHVTGSDSFIVKVLARDIAHLEEVIAQFSSLGQSVSAIVLSSFLASKDIPIPLSSFNQSS